MVIRNISKGKIVSKDANLALSFLDRLLGLVNHKNSRYLIIYTRFGIHTFFLKHPIDILILDSNMKVVKIKRKLKPFSLYFYPIKYFTVVELPDGTIEKGKICLNDKISIE